MTQPTASKLALIGLTGLMLLSSPAAGLTLSLVTPAGGAFAFRGTAEAGAGGVTDTKLFEPNPAVIPFAGGPTALAGGAVASTAFSANPTLVSGSHQGLTVAGDPTSYSLMKLQFDFTIDEIASYEITGQLSTVDSVGQFVGFSAFLWEDPQFLPTVLFENTQTSIATPNEVLSAGLSEGDSFNSLAGSTTGLLIPGKVYRFFSSGVVANDALPAVEMTSQFDVALTLTAVPEASTAVMLSAALLLRTFGRRSGQEHVSGST